MNIISGIDSTIPSSKQIDNDYKLYEWAIRAGSFPEFWGRNISGDNRLTLEEVEFLHEKKCKIVLIYDQLTEAQVSTVNGSGEAICAVEIARELGVPFNSDIALFARIRDDWSVNHNWMISYAYTLLENGFIPGFIGNTDSSKNFCFDRHASHYVNFMANIARDRTVFWATQPKLNSAPITWNPYCPSALSPEEIGLWSSNAKATYNDITINKVYARDEAILQFMW